MLYNLYSFAFSYTIEASFGLMRGANVGAKQFIKMGEDIAEATN